MHRAEGIYTIPVMVENNIKEKQLPNEATNKLTSNRRQQDHEQPRIEVGFDQQQPLLVSLLCKATSHRKSFTAVTLKKEWAAGHSRH